MRSKVTLSILLINIYLFSINFLKNVMLILRLILSKPTCVVKPTLPLRSVSGRQIREKPCVPALCIYRFLYLRGLWGCAATCILTQFTQCPLRCPAWDIWWLTRGGWKDKAIITECINTIKSEKYNTGRKKQITRYVNYYTCLTTSSHTVYEGKRMYVCLYIYVYIYIMKMYK